MQMRVKIGIDNSSVRSSLCNSPSLSGGWFQDPGEYQNPQMLKFLTENGTVRQPSILVWIQPTPQMQKPQLQRANCECLL